MHSIFVRKPADADSPKEPRGHRRHWRRDHGPGRLTRLWKWCCEQDRIISDAFEHAYHPWKRDR